MKNKQIVRKKRRGCPKKNSISSTRSPGHTFCTKFTATSLWHLSNSESKALSLLAETMGSWRKSWEATWPNFSEVLRRRSGAKPEKAASYGIPYGVSGRKLQYEVEYIYNICICKYTSMYIYIYIYIHLHKYTYMMHIYIHIYTYNHIYTYSCVTYVCIFFVCRYTILMGSIGESSLGKNLFLSLHVKVWIAISLQYKGRYDIYGFM